jgi:hypothetical protein
MNQKNKVVLHQFSLFEAYERAGDTVKAVDEIRKIKFEPHRYGKRFGVMFNGSYIIHPRLLEPQAVGVCQLLNGALKMADGFLVQQLDEALKIAGVTSNQEAEDGGATEVVGDR